ncbi:hypothetical protein D9M70_565070 [compost metagenome]
MPSGKICPPGQAFEALEQALHVTQSRGHGLGLAELHRARRQQIQAVIAGRQRTGVRRPQRRVEVEHCAGAQQRAAGTNLVQMLLGLFVRKDIQRT